MELKKVAYEPMNEVHENEIKVLEKLINELNENKNIKKTLEEFIKDVEKHFSFEESLMKKYQFFAYIPHKMEHDKIINELYELRDKDHKHIKQYINERFIPWLNQHIETMDTVTGGFFNMIGAKNEF